MTERTLIRNAADPEQVAKAGKVQDRRQKELVAAFNDILKTYQGRLWLYWLLEQCGLESFGVFTLSYMGNVEDALVNEGRRRVGNQVMAAIVELNPEYYVMMMKEAKDRRANDNG